MEAVAQYVLRLVCGSVVCSLILAMTGSDGPGGKIRRLLCGLFLATLALGPVANLELDDLIYLDPAIAARAEELSQSGVFQAKEAMAAGISDQCSAYILNKAEELGLTLQAEVELDESTGIPVAVRLTGNAPPYEREALIGYISRTLGIERSGIQWLS